MVEFFCSCSTSILILILQINLTRYFELSRHFSVLINTLRMSFRRVVAFMLSILPVFLAYVVLGVAVFSNYSQRFGSFDQVAVALFCVANGDELHATFEDLRLTFPWQVVAQLYLYTFLVLFIFGILNIIIFVVDDAFEAAKNWDRAAWKERQQFTLANLIAILELEGKELKNNPSAHSGWQLLDYEAQMTEAAPLISTDEVQPMQDPISAEGPEGIPIGSSVGNSDTNVGQEPPWRLTKSITKAIQIERKKKRAEKMACSSSPLPPPTSAMKEKNEVTEEDDLDAALDAALLSLTDDLHASIAKLKVG